MANPNGNPSALVPAPPGNLRGWKHGGYSETGLQERVDEMVAEVMALPHVCDLDLPAARELAHLQAMAERISAALADGRVENRKGEVRALLEARRRLSVQLVNLMESFGMTPKSRSEWARTLAQPTFAERVEHRLQEGAR